MKTSLMVLLMLALFGDHTHAAESPLLVGFAETDITPTLGKKVVYVAGFGRNRKATAIHDRLYARAIVLKHEKKTIAMVSVDLVGFFYANVLNVRKQLPDLDYVMVSATHNHEGPDTLGIWGSNPLVSGVDPDYLAFVEKQIVKAVQQANKNVIAANARIGKVNAPELLHDGREPFVKHDELVVLEFLSVKDKKRIGLVVQWNCHPETLGSKNTEISADYVGVTVNELSKKYTSPVVYFTGTVGGLMTSLHVPIKDQKGNLLNDGTWEKTERYGQLVAERAGEALSNVKPIKLTPLTAKHKPVFIPLDNAIYLAARELGVLNRKAYFWQGDPYKAKETDKLQKGKRLALLTEVGYLQLGQLSVVLHPGEVYPELVLGKVQDPVDIGSDYPKAKAEPALYSNVPGPHRMIIGLANDEIGYVIPKRQWDKKKPFCYGRKKTQYGEINSVGPETAPILCEAFRKLVQSEK